MLNKGNLYEVNDTHLKEDQVPLNEYPRPTLVRSHWLNLNGAWDFAISKYKKIPNSFKKKIIVPYAVESPLSHIHQLVEPDDYLIYQKKITLPSTMKEKTILLHFNGIDQTADVYLDRRLVKSHEGIMSFIVSFPYQKEITITVIINDKSDLSYLARGKQTLEPNAYLYSSSSGIIKTVWLEAVNKTYIEDIKFYPDYDKNNHWEELVATKRMAYIPSERDLVNNGGKTNDSEANIVTEIVKACVELRKKNGIADADMTIGVITGYRSQIAKIRHKLEDAGVADGIVIDTVERYQGGQMDIIIYSFCVNQDYQLDFVCDAIEENGKTIDRKLNVALTRARKQLFVVGNEEMLRQVPIYSTLIDFMK